MKVSCNLRSVTSPFLWFLLKNFDPSDFPFHFQQLVFPFRCKCCRFQIVRNDFYQEFSIFCTGNLFSFSYGIFRKYKLLNDGRSCCRCSKTFLFGFLFKVLISLLFPWQQVTYLRYILLVVLYNALFFWTGTHRKIVSFTLPGNSFSDAQNSSIAIPWSFLKHSS